jgi:hypothetical protein
VKDISEAIEEAIKESLLDIHSSVYDAVFNAVFSVTWTVLPPGSHLQVLQGDKWVRGADVVGLKTYVSHTEVLTARGEQLRLNQQTFLAVGGSDA